MNSTALAPLWLQILQTPAIELAAFALVVRWVVAPAMNTYFRREFKSELAQIASFPLAIQRLEATERAIEELTDVPQAVARIEGQLREVLERRSHPR